MINMEKPLVSVVMPVYNGAQTVALALNSLIGQTYTNWECIVVNDGSDDATMQVLSSFTDGHIKVVDLVHNCGRGVARNVALSNCRGYYICFLVSDDFLNPEKIEKQVDTMQNNDIDLCFCGFTKFDDNGTPIFTSGLYNVPKTLHKDGEQLPPYFPSVMIINQRAALFSYNLRLNVGEDYDFISKYLDGRYYMNIPEPLYYYRIGDTTRKKLLYFTKENIRAGFYLFQRNKKAGINIICASSIKYIVYWVLTLIMPAKCILYRRGEQITSENKKIFERDFCKYMYNKTLTGGDKTLRDINSRMFAFVNYPSLAMVA